MKTRYAPNDGPSVSRIPFNSYVQHGHFSSIDYHSYWPDDTKLRQEIDTEVKNVKGCLGFFKTYEKNPTLGAKAKAAVASAIAEDEAYLDELQKHRP